MNLEYWKEWRPKQQVLSKSLSVEIRWGDEREDSRYVGGGVVVVVWEEAVKSKFVLHM